MRRRAKAAATHVHFYTDPLCPWSWAMEPLVAALREDPSLRFRSVMTGWLPSLGSDTRTVRSKWSDAAAKTRAQIDPAYWDRVAPRTSLLAGAAVKAADLQGTAKGEAFLEAVREAVFVHDADPTSFEALVDLAETSELRADLFRTDLGVGRYTVDDLVAAIDRAKPLSESVWWFGRRHVLRNWFAMAADLADAERRKLACPAFRVVRGEKEVTLRGVVGDAQLRDAIRSLT